MAVTIRTPAAPVAAPATTLYKLIQMQSEEFSKARYVRYCMHSSHNGSSGGERGGLVSYSAKMRQITESVFQLLQSAAFGGKTAAIITFAAWHEVDYEPLIHFTVLKFLQDRMALLVLCEWPHQQKTNTHSTFCALNEKSIDLSVSWSPTNPYLNPKPVLLLGTAEVWGVDKLNQERQCGRGDLTIVFGEHSFAAHRLIVQSFSPLMEKMLTSSMKEASSGVLELPEVKCSQKALEALMTLMYTKQIDLSQLHPSEVIELYELSSYLVSDALKGLAFTHLHNIGSTLDDFEILNLCFIQIKLPSKDLKDLCDWLLRIWPEFYKDILIQEKMPIEDLFKLFAVSSDFKIEVLKERLQTEWDKLETSQKTAFVARACAEGDYLHILEMTKEFCKGALKTIDSKDADRPGFVAAFKQLNDQIVELEIR